MVLEFVVCHTEVSYFSLYFRKSCHIFTWFVSVRLYQVQC